MKVSELTREDVIRFAKIEDPDDDIAPEALLAAAKAFVRGYTGMDDAAIDEHEDITIAVLVLCADMYEHRLTTADTAQANRTVETILGLYRENLL